MAQSAHNRYALGVDIGGSHVCSAVVDLATGQLCGEPHTDKVDAAAGARTIAGAWAANIRAHGRGIGHRTHPVRGFAFPGPFDYERGISLIRGVRKFERIYGSTSRRRSTRCCGSCGTGGVPLRQRRGGLRAGRMPRRGRGRRRTRSALTLGTGVGSGFVAGRRLVTSGDEVPANGWVYCRRSKGASSTRPSRPAGYAAATRELTGQEISGAREAANAMRKTPRHGAYSTNTGSGWRHSQPPWRNASAPTCWYSAGISLGPTRCSGPPWNAGSKPTATGR